MLSISKEFTFEAAHALDLYHGKCQYLHGHSYKLVVQLSGEPDTSNNASTAGMIMDFKELKHLINEQVIELFDHRLILHEESRFRGIEKLDSRVRYVSYHPTCEMILLEIVEQIKQHLPPNVQLTACVLHETSSSYATWNADL